MSTIVSTYSLVICSSASTTLGSLTFDPLSRCPPCVPPAWLSQSPLGHNTTPDPHPMTLKTHPPENCPTMPLQGVPGSHLHCFGEAEVILNTCYCQQSHMNLLTQSLPEQQYLFIHVSIHLV